jgi:hypothetical protein
MTVAVATVMTLKMVKFKWEFLHNYSELGLGWYTKFSL